ncbi:MAG: hypothetical protein JXX28_17555 [Deltaproteobacteria bacterium]|nr:hypothetical protein [Deltaproteobacteria bacterium]
MNYRHVILEGKPTTGKTEVSELLKIYFPGQVIVLPELTTVLVRAHGLNILRDRAPLSAMLEEAVPARSAEVERLLAEHPASMVLEESHMGVHWAYSAVIDDRTFLDLYDEKIAPHVRIPDLFLRLDIPIELSVRRQKARATKDVEVDGALVSRMFENLNRWHNARGHGRLHLLNTDRSPEIVLTELLDLLGLRYGA